MREFAEERDPRVFVSHAWGDELAVKRFVADVERHGPELFVDSRDIPPGANVVAAINEAIDESDYFVLLWSSKAEGREWITLEWCAALVRGIREQRAFLYIVRLDNTDPPLLLAPTLYIDAFEDWDGAVLKLVEAWRRDQALGVPVLPAPHPPDDELPVDGRVVVLHLYNTSLKVVHLVTARLHDTVIELEKRIRTMLGLLEIVSAHDGLVGMRFSYLLAMGGKHLQPNDTLAELGVSDYTVINLEIWKEEFGPDGISGPVVYRDGEAGGIRAPMEKSLISQAFGHLMPVRRRR